MEAGNLGPAKERSAEDGTPARSARERPAKSRRDGVWVGEMYARFNAALFSLCNFGAVNDVAWPTNYRFNGLNGMGQAPSDWMKARIQLKAPVIPAPQPGKPAYRALHQLKV